MSRFLLGFLAVQALAGAVPLLVAGVLIVAVVLAVTFLVDFMLYRI